MNLQALDDLCINANVELIAELLDDVHLI